MASKWEKEADTIKTMIEQGKTNQEIADYFDISESNVSSIISRLRKKGLVPYRENIEEQKIDTTEENRQKLKVDFKNTKKSELDWKDFIESAIGLQEQKKKKKISQQEAEIDIETDKAFAIVFSSDWHLGSKGVDYASFLKHIKMISSIPELLAGILGDVTDNFVKNKHKSGMFEALFSPQDQQDVVKEIFSQLGRNVIFKTSGNHDNWSFGEAGIDYAKYIYKNCRDAPYLKHGGGLEINVNDEITYRIYAKHKYRYNSSLNMTHTVKRLFEQESPFDIGIIAHHHIPAIEQVNRWSGKYKRNIICIRTGSYKINDEWARAHGFDGGQIGVPTVVFYPNKKHMVPFWKIEDAVKYLKSINSGGD